MDNNSLMPAKISLLIEFFSLLIYIGNFAKNRCGAVLSCLEVVVKSLENAKFPVKFPANREISQRRLRSALRRQPGDPIFQHIGGVLIS